MTHTVPTLVSHFQDKFAGSAPQSGSVPDLVDRLIAHEALAFEELVREHGPRLLAVATRYLRRAADAEDALQDAFVNVVRSIGGFERASSLETWLHRIVVNCSLMSLRRRRRKPEMALADSTLESCAALPRRSPPPSADLTLESEELADQVRAAVAGLPEAQSAVLLLRDVQSLGLKAIAELLSIGVSTVKLRLRGARHALHFALSPKAPLVPLRHWPVKPLTRAPAPILAV